jgi:hypothetical protein
MYGTSGALFDSGVTTTKTSGSGGTGDWTSHVKVDLNMPAAIENLQNSGSLGIQVTKTGTGVKIPTGTFVVETSRWKYY